MKICRVIFLRILLLLPCVALAGSALLLVWYTHLEFTYLIFSPYGASDKLEKFRSELLTPERYMQLRYLLSLLTVPAGKAAYAGWQHTGRLLREWDAGHQYLRVLGRRLRIFWQLIPAWEKYSLAALLIGLAAVRWLLMLRLPFHIDERFTYLYFVSKGLGVSAAYYPNPNNHILYTLLCNVSHWVLGDPWWSMKLPAFIAGLLLAGLVWLLARYFTGPYVGLLAVCLFAFAGPVFYYGTQGRGYSLLMLFVGLMTWSAWRISTQATFRRSSYGIFWLSSVLGFYTIPIFLYPFAATSVWLMLRVRNKPQFIRLLLTGVCIGISVGILYLPVLLFNGWTAVSGNSWVAPLPWPEFFRALPPNLTDIARNLWGELPYGGWLTAGILLFCGFLLVQPRVPEREKFLAGLFITHVLMVLIIMGGQRILLYQRVVVYLSIFQYPLLALLLSRIIREGIRMPAGRGLAAALMGLAYIYLNVGYFYRLSDPDRFDLYDSFDRTAEILYASNADNIFVNYYEYSLCIRFRYETRGRSLSMDTNQPVAGTPYQYLVVHRSYPFPPGIEPAAFRPLYTDAEVAVYKRADE